MLKELCPVTVFICMQLTGSLGFNNVLITTKLLLSLYKKVVLFVSGKHHTFLLFYNIPSSFKYGQTRELHANKSRIHFDARICIRKW